MLHVSFLPIRADILNALWEKFDSNRGLFPDELPPNPIEFTCWLAAADAMAVGINTDDGRLVGIFLFTGIVREESCWAHVFIWDKDADEPKEFIRAAQVAAAAVFQSTRVRRINGLTPVTHLPALVFSEKVGFVKEGRLREAAKVGGKHVDAWISSMLPTDLEAAISKKPAP